MKKLQTLKFVVPLLLAYCMLAMVLFTQAQNKKYKARLSVDYIKTMGADPVIKVSVKFKGENGYEPATDLPLNIYQQLAEDSLNLVGEINTNKNGVASYQLVNFGKDVGDSIITYNYVAKIENNEKFKKAKKSIRFSDVNLLAEVMEIDSVKYISAKLTNVIGKPLAGEKLKVMVHRLFAPLTIGNSSYRTEKDGIILVPLEKPLPGIDGKLTFEVMLESRKYGTVRHIFEAQIGKPIIDKSTFDQRTMWSPQNKTPVFLLIFPNIIILGIWAIIILLINNLIKIYKS